MLDAYHELVEKEDLNEAEKRLLIKWDLQRLNNSSGGGMLIIITYTNTIIYHYHY